MSEALDMLCSYDSPKGAVSHAACQLTVETLSSVYHSMTVFWLLVTFPNALLLKFLVSRGIAGLLAQLTGLCHLMSIPSPSPDPVVIVLLLFGLIL